MRIALIDPSLFTLPYDAALAGGLEAVGHRVTLHGRPILPQDGHAARFRIEPDFYRIAAVFSGWPRAFRLAVKGLDHAVSLARLLRRLQRERPDVIHFQWLPLPLIDRAFLAAFRRIAPVVLTVHDTNAFNGDPTARLQRVGFAAALAACDRLIVHTAQGEARLRALGMPHGAISVLPHGLLETEAEIASPSASAEPGALTFVLFGKIKPYKGADLLLTAFARLPDELRQHARVRIIGQAYMKLGPLLQCAVQSGIADYCAVEDRFVTDAEIATVFGPGAVAAFPYREIEASGVLSLAIAHGRPVIASNLGMFAEALTDGVHGRLVPPGDVSALSAAMAQMIRDRRFTASCAEAVLALGRNMPDWAEIGRMTQRVYASAIAARIAAAEEPAHLSNEVAPS
jgi:glycosyltransferase involved in cell wall biosynthesis